MAGGHCDIPVNKQTRDNICRYSETDIEEVLERLIGPGYRRYRERWNTAGPGVLPDFPVHLDIEVNDRCNQSCRMCPRNSRMHGKMRYRLNTGAVLAYSNYCRVIDEGAERNLASVNLGAFAEPLLNPEVFRMVAYAHKRGVVDTRLITNGLLLDRFIDQVFGSGLVHLFVSLDAHTEDTYSRIRGRGFTKVQANLQILLEEKRRRDSVLPIVRVSFLEMGINRREKEEFISFWRNRVDFVDIQLFDDFNADPTGPVNLKTPKKWSCRAPWVRMSVLAKGDILPCCNFFGRNIPLGNLAHMTLQQAWESEAMARVRKGILADDLDNCSICQRVGE
jgi:radical SAM protein with 4Fe4S-binding SPASM domain